MPQDDRETKNAIFQQQSDTQAPRSSIADQVKAQFGVDVPTEIVPIPSRGKAYPQQSPLFGLEQVMIKSMTAREEDILMSRALIKKGTVITELIKSCLCDKTIDPAQLLVGDRNALMVAVRITGYGAKYDAEVRCSECNEKSERHFDLGTLPIKFLEIDPVSPGNNAFEYVLPTSKKRIVFRFMTGLMEEELTTTLENKKKLKMNTDTSVTTGLLYSIVSVEGVEDRSKIAQFVQCMSARDSRDLRKFIKDNEPGMQMKQTTKCGNDECGHEEEVDMPLGVSFLWPQS
jgi:hypothetical protein